MSCIYSTPCPEEFMLTLNHAQTKFDEEAIYPEDVIVSVCAGLVIVDRMSHVIRLVHYTTQKYFDCERRAELFPDIELKITKTCISYLLFDDFETEELTHGEEHIEVNDELHSKYPLLEYAGENWGHHARGENEYLAGDMIGRLLQQKLRLFLVCDLIDQSGIRAFGPVPALTVLVYFGLRRYIGSIANFDESSDLTCAIRYRRKELVFFLVERGADWYDTGACSLQAACSFFQLKGSEGMVISLAEKGVTMDLSVDNGEFLFNRVWLKSSDTEGRRLMEALLELGAAFDPQNITYYTPLMCAAIEGDFLSWDIEKLLKSGVPVSEKNELERDPLIYAALARFEAAVRPLLEAGADVHSRDEGGMTALSAACEGGNAHIVKLLLEHGADVSAKDRNSRTPMSIAVESGNAVMIRLLRGEGMDEPDEKPFFPETEAPLHRMWHLIRPGGTVGLPEYKPVEVARPGAFRRGYDKIMPAWVDEFFKIKARKKNSTNVEEQKHEKVDSDGASP